MSQVVAEKVQGLRRWPVRSVLVAVTLLLATGAFLGARSLTQTDAIVEPPSGAVPPSPMPAHPDIVAKYGVQFVQVGLSGDGGLIDVRLRILDTTKAGQVLGHHSAVKTVIGDERAGKLLDTRAMTPGDSNLAAGQGYYILLRNAAGTVRRGDFVDLFVGPYEIKHIRVM